jgi:hypothetical protein
MMLRRGPVIVGKAMQEYGKVVMSVAEITLQTFLMTHLRLWRTEHTQQLVAVQSLLGSRVRIPPATWMSVSCECYVLSSRGVCNGLFTRPEFYRAWCVLSVILKLRHLGGPDPLELSNYEEKICIIYSRSRRPCGLDRRSAAAQLPGSQVRISLRSWMLCIL